MLGWLFGQEAPAARADDDAIVRFADLLGAGARVTVHLSLDDALFQGQEHPLPPLLARLGLSEAEAISNPMLTRAIARVQAGPRR